MHAYNADMEALADIEWPEPDGYHGIPVLNDAGVRHMAIVRDAAFIAGCMNAIVPGFLTRNSDTKTPTSGFFHLQLESLLGRGSLTATSSDRQFGHFLNVASGSASYAAVVREAWGLLQAAIANADARMLEREAEVALGSQKELTTLLDYHVNNSWLQTGVCTLPVTFRERILFGQLDPAAGMWTVSIPIARTVMTPCELRELETLNGVYNTTQTPSAITMFTIRVSLYAGSFACLFLFGHIRDFFRQIFDKWSNRQKTSKSGYASIRQDYEDFYTRRLYYRIHDCWNRPIGSAPDRTIKVLERSHVDGLKPLQLTGNELECINLGSYNYLGFAASDEFCTPRVINSIREYGWSACSPRSMGGTCQEHAELEASVASFLGKEDSIVLGMGFATNSMILPVLVGPGDLVISDALNHASIVNGVRGSGAKVKVFKHNNAGHLERVLRNSIADGQPRTHRPWKKVLVVVEGIYSMEGEMCNLAAIVEVKKKYKAYLYLDEAHSIGALGQTGRGVCEQLGVDTADIDIMMGTFTKSFGSCGGYVAADTSVIQHLRLHSPGSINASAMSPPACQQVTSALKLMLGEDGSRRGAQKIAQLRLNSNYMRRKLVDMGLAVLGDDDSPVMPVMIYSPGKIAAFSRKCLERRLATVVVGFPATPLLLARCRVCVSAAHTQEDLDKAVEVLDEVTSQCLMKFRAPLKHSFSKA
eukprot:jgi/Tetstr1/462176/TSEL_007241.t1